MGWSKIIPELLARCSFKDLIFWVVSPGESLDMIATETADGKSEAHLKVGKIRHTVIEQMMQLMEKDNNLGIKYVNASYIRVGENGQGEIIFPYLYHK